MFCHYKSADINICLATESKGFVCKSIIAQIKVYLRYLIFLSRLFDVELAAEKAIRNKTFGPFSCPIYVDLFMQIKSSAVCLRRVRERETAIVYATLPRYILFSFHPPLKYNYPCAARFIILVSIHACRLSKCNTWLVIRRR